MKKELIGLLIEIVASTNQSLVGMKGVVRDETQNSFVVETKKGKKRVLKSSSRFIFHVGKDKIEVDGAIIAKRPEDRTKQR